MAALSTENNTLHGVQVTAENIRDKEAGHIHEFLKVCCAAVYLRASGPLPAPSLYRSTAAVTTSVPTSTVFARPVRFPQQFRPSQPHRRLLQFNNSARPK